MTDTEQGNVANIKNSKFILKKHADYIKIKIIMVYSKPSFCTCLATYVLNYKHLQLALSLSPHSMPCTKGILVNYG